MAYERLRNSGLTQGLTDLLADLGDLVQKEIQFAKAEVTEKITSSLRASVWMMAAAVLGLIAGLLVGMGLIGLLRTSPSQASSSRNGGAADDHSHLQHRNDNDASLAEQTAKIADVAKQKVQDWSEQ
jgi:hypothetical protein